MVSERELSLFSASCAFCHNGPPMFPDCLTLHIFLWKALSVPPNKKNTQGCYLLVIFWVWLKMNLSLDCSSTCWNVKKNLERKFITFTKCSMNSSVKQPSAMKSSRLEEDSTTHHMHGAYLYTDNHHQLRENILKQYAKPFSRGRMCIIAVYSLQ